MPVKRKVSDEILFEAYSRLKSVKKVGEEVGMCGQSVHQRLCKIGANTPLRIFTPAEENILKAKYSEYRDAGKLDVLAKQMGRTKHFICRQARKLGMTSQGGPKLYGRVWMGIDELTARKWWRQFKASPLTMRKWCEEVGIDDLGFSRSMQEHFPDEWEHVIEAKVTANTFYRSGRKVEYAVRNDLIARKYPIVMRATLSRGPADVIAIKPGVVLLIQCKRGLSMGVGEWNRLFDLAKSINATPIMAGQPNGTVIVYRKLTGKKMGNKAVQPMCDFIPI